MRITDIHVDGFGVWKDLTMDGLREGVTVFYGPNEAGKTTLMQFVRAVLYGFSPERRSRYLPPVNGGIPGGYLGVDDDTGVFRIVRRLETNASAHHLGDVTVVAKDGVNFGQSQLDNLLSGVDEPTFNNVFGIGLREIQELATLDDTAAADHLYRLTGGLDRVSLVDVVRGLHKDRQAIASTNDEGEKTGLIAPLVDQRNKLRREIQELAVRRDRWLKLATTKQDLQNEAAELERQISELESRIQSLEVVLQCRDVWHARSEVLARLEAIGVPTRVTPKHVQRLEELNKEVKANEEKVREHRLLRKQLLGESKKLKVDADLWSNAPRIKAITEQSSWLAALETQMGKLREELRGMETQLNGSGPKPVTLLEPQQNGVPIGSLRRVYKQVEEEEDKHEVAKRAAQEAKLEVDRVTQRIENRLLERNETELTGAIQRASERIQMLRKRMQVDQTIDQLGRYHNELEQYRDELFDKQTLPMGTNIVIGVIFVVGVMLLLSSIVGSFFEWFPEWHMAVWIGLIGAICATIAAAYKISHERQTSLRLEGVRRQLTNLNRQYGDAKQSRETLDQQLPTGSGTWDVRLQRAEEDLRRLEELTPQEGQRVGLQTRYESALRAQQEAEQNANDARERWRNALRSAGLPDDYTLSMVRNQNHRVEDLSHVRRRYDLQREELAQREREWISLSTRIDQLMGDMRLQPESEHPKARLEQLSRIVGGQQAVVEQRRDYVRKGRLARREHLKALADWKQKHRLRLRLMKKVGIRREKDFRAAAEKWTEALALRQKRDGLSKSLMGILSDRLSEEQVAHELGEDQTQSVELRREHAAERIKELRAKLVVVHEKRGQAQQEMASLAADRRMDDARWELRSVEQQLTEHATKWQTLAATDVLLNSVRKGYETNRQPETLREASEYLKRLTQSGYTRIWTPVEERNLRIDDSHGKPMRLDLLSRGTMEAVFISLRLSLANSFKRRSATMPMVFDDVFVNFDSRRTKLAAELLVDFTRQNGQQILMFTCHEHIARIFHAAGAAIRTLPGHDLDLNDLPKPLPTPTPVVQRLVEPEPPVVEPVVVELAAPKRKRRTRPTVSLETTDWTPEVALPVVPATVIVAGPEPTPRPVIRDVVETVPDFHEVGSRVWSLDDGLGTDLLHSDYIVNDVYGPTEVDLRERPVVIPQKLVDAEPVRKPEERKIIQTIITTERRQNFTWDSPEIYWDKVAAEFAEAPGRENIDNVEWRPISREWNE